MKIPDNLLPKISSFIYSEQWSYFKEFLTYLQTENDMMLRTVAVVTPFQGRARLLTELLTLSDSIQEEQKRKKQDG